MDKCHGRPCKNVVLGKYATDVASIGIVSRVAFTDPPVCAVGHTEQRVSDEGLDVCSVFSPTGDVPGADSFGGMCRARARSSSTGGAVSSWAGNAAALGDDRDRRAGDPRPAVARGCQRSRRSARCGCTSSRHMGYDHMVTTAPRPAAFEVVRGPAPALSMANQSWLGRLVRWLAGRTSAAVFGMFLAWFAVWTVSAYLVLDTVISAQDQADLGTIAGPLMGALGALFAFLTAFVITTEWGQHREAEHTLGMEADACVRLAWISQSPGCDGAAIRRDLAAYLGSVLNEEWPELADGRGCETTHDRMGELQYRVRGIAAEPDVPASVSNDLTTAADAIAVTRAERLNAASRDLPTPLFLLAFLSGVVLTLNAIVLALQLDHAHGLAIAGIVALIPLDLALLLAIAMPFQGDLRVEGHALARVLDNLTRGRYGPL